MRPPILAALVSRRGRLVRLLRAREGGTALEYGIVALPMMMLMFGVFEVSRLIFINQTLQQAATATARCIGVKSPYCTSNGTYDATATTAYLQTWLSDASLSASAPALTVAATASTACSNVDGFSQVTLTYTFQTVVPALLGPWASGLSLNAEACFPNQP
jgi:Flp pilus assembly protein TadG